MYRYHTDNWRFTLSHPNDPGDLNLRVFITIHPNGMVEAVTRTLDGGLLRKVTGMLLAEADYSRNGRFRLSYKVQVYNRLGEPAPKFLEAERSARAAAYRLADLAIDLSCNYNPVR